MEWKQSLNHKKIIMPTRTIIASAILIVLLIYAAYQCLKYIFNLQKSIVEKDKLIAFSAGELKRWETYNIGLLGDLAYLIDSNDQEMKAKIKRKWKANFAKRKEMTLDKAGIEQPSKN